jgi:hypothetical protein
MKIDLQKIAFSIFELCVKCFIFLGVARSLNIEADLYSKVFDFDDWEVLVNGYLNCLTKSGDRTLLIDLLIARIVKWKSLILSFGHQAHLALTHLYMIGPATIIG